MKFLALFSGVVAVSSSPVGDNKLGGDLEHVIFLLGEMLEEAEGGKVAAESSNGDNDVRLGGAITIAEAAATDAGKLAAEARLASKAAQAAIEEQTQNLERAVAEINTQKDNKNAEKEQRATAKADYNAKEADAELGIAACDELLEALKQVEDKADTTTFFLQKKINSIPNVGRARALIQAVQKFSESGVVYKKDEKFKEIETMIEDLKSQLDKDFEELKEEEETQSAAHALKVNSCDGIISTNEEKKKTAEDGISGEEVLKAESDKKNEDALAEQKAQQALFDELTQELSQATQEHEQADVARDEEIKAINKAIEILNANEAEINKKNTAAGEQAAALLQITRNVNEDGKIKALAFLRKQAAQLHSKPLLMLAEVADDGPFAKVTELIRDLLVRLKEEMAAAQTKHEKCVKDMKENADGIKASKREIQGLDNEIAAQEATTSEMEVAIEQAEEDLDVCQNDLDKGEDFFTGRNSYLTEFLHDGSVTHYAFSQALVALRKGAEKAGGGGPGFSGTGSMSTIIKLLEHVQIKQGEANDEAQKEKTELMADWKAEEKRLKELNDTLDAQKKTSTETKIAANQAKTTAQATKDNEQKTLDNLKQNKKGIEQVCIAQGATHAENAEVRQQEIISLQEALRILNNETVQDPPVKTTDN